MWTDPNDFESNRSVSVYRPHPVTALGGTDGLELAETREIPTVNTAGSSVPYVFTPRHWRSPRGGKNCRGGPAPRVIKSRLYTNVTTSCHCRLGSRQKETSSPTRGTRRIAVPGAGFLDCQYVSPDRQSLPTVGSNTADAISPLDGGAR